MKYALVLTLLLFTTTVHAGDIKDEWLACTGSGDCTVTTGKCNFDVAVSKEHLNDVNKMAGEWEDCQTTGSPDPDATAKCVEQKCVLNSAGH